MHNTEEKKHISSGRPKTHRKKRSIGGSAKWRHHKRHHRKYVHRGGFVVPPALATAYNIAKVVKLAS